MNCVRGQGNPLPSLIASSASTLGDKNVLNGVISEENQYVITAKICIDSPVALQRELQKKRNAQTDLQSEGRTFLSPFLLCGIWGGGGKEMFFGKSEKAGTSFNKPNFPSSNPIHLCVFWDMIFIIPPGGSLRKLGIPAFIQTLRSNHCAVVK